MIPTSQLAAVLGVRPGLLRQWAIRGRLRLAPIGRPGQGQGNENMWSQAAVAEAKRLVAERGFRR